MSTPLSAQLTGSFTSDGEIRDISLPSGFTEFEMTNISDIGSTAANTNVMESRATSDMPDGSGYFGPKTSGAATIALTVTTLTGGFTFVDDSASVSLGAANSTITAIGQDTPSAVVSLTSTAGLSEQDVIRVFDTTGMLQIAGWDFTIDTVTTDTSFNLAFLDSSGFAVPATEGTLRRVPFDARFYPRNRRITNIQPSFPVGNTVIQLSVTHGFTIGQLVRIKVPAQYGMIELDNALVEITGEDIVNNEIVISVDSTSFTPFTFPTSGEAAAGVEVPQVIPVGEAATEFSANLLDDATENRSFRGVQIGTTVQTDGVLYQWVAKRGVRL